MIKKKKIPNDFEKSFQLYFQDIGKYSSLSLEEEQHLWEMYKNNNDINARDKLIKSNLKFVANVAKSYQGRGLSYTDLIAEGNCGLIKSFDKFDYTRGYKTISYSVWWIKQAILEALKERNCIDGDDLPMDFEKQKEGDEEINNNEVNNIVDLIIEDDFLDEEKNQEIANAIHLLMDVLTKREKIIISEYFGLKDKAKTLEEIGDSIGLTKERVRQIKEKALKKLRSEALINSISSDIYK